eukprot:TRINITY_DN3292_c0_g1_i1.p1 TRINITY_DN3292_c0_g1~~TRINITY_DN3292_c0_g1_i1.p1  ORF type:complete len:510 (+),score=63.18 TRINITY_DN3292_c0_g1_i1:267-1796(+)
MSTGVLVIAGGFDNEVRSLLSSAIYLQRTSGYHVTVVCSSKFKSWAVNCGIPRVLESPVDYEYYLTNECDSDTFFREAEEYFTQEDGNDFIECHYSTWLNQQVHTYTRKNLNKLILAFESAFKIQGIETKFIVTGYTLSFLSYCFAQKYNVPIYYINHLGLKEYGPMGPKATIIEKLFDKLNDRLWKSQFEDMIRTSGYFQLEPLPYIWKESLHIVMPECYLFEKSYYETCESRSPTMESTKKNNVSTTFISKVTSFFVSNPVKIKTSVLSEGFVDTNMWLSVGGEEGVRATQNKEGERAASSLGEGLVSNLILNAGLDIVLEKLEHLEPSRLAGKSKNVFVLMSNYPTVIQKNIVQMIKSTTHSDDNEDVDGGHNNRSSYLNFLLICPSSSVTCGEEYSNVIEFNCDDDLGIAEFVKKSATYCDVLMCSGDLFMISYGIQHKIPLIIVPLTYQQRMWGDIISGKGYGESVSIWKISSKDVLRQKIDRLFIKSEEGNNNNSNNSFQGNL